MAITEMECVHIFIIPLRWKKSIHPYPTYPVIFTLRILFFQEQEPNGDINNHEVLNDRNEEDRLTASEKNKELQNQLEVCFVYNL